MKWALFSLFILSALIMPGCHDSVTTNMVASEQQSRDENRIIEYDRVGNELTSEWLDNELARISKDPRNDSRRWRYSKIAEMKGLSGENQTKIVQAAYEHLEIDSSKIVVFRRLMERLDFSLEAKIVMLDQIDQIEYGRNRLILINDIFSRGLLSDDSNSGKNDQLNLSLEEENLAEVYAIGSLKKEIDRLSYYPLIAKRAELSKKTELRLIDELNKNIPSEMGRVDCFEILIHNENTSDIAKWLIRKSVDYLEDTVEKQRLIKLLGS